MEFLLKLKIMSGTGNTFVFADLKNSKNLSALTKYTGKLNLNEIARHLCTKDEKIAPVDGAVFIIENDDFDFAWRFFNSDGSEAEMCGNAARCAGQFAYELGLVSKRSMNFLTQSGPIFATIIDDESVSVEMAPVIVIKKQGSVSFEGQQILFDHLDTGVPHCVIKVDKLDQLQDFLPLAKFMRNLNIFGARGANVTFRKNLVPGLINSATFERGVEGFTLACGTGAVAAAYSTHLVNPEIEQIQVYVPGGELTVNLEKRNPTLTGKVETIIDLEI